MLVTIRATPQEVADLFRRLTTPIDGQLVELRTEFNGPDLFKEATEDIRGKLADNESKW